MTAVILGIAWWYQLRRTTIVLAVYLFGTMVATVYLGWHFAVDDVAGLAIAALSWWLGPRTVGVLRRQRLLEPTSHGHTGPLGPGVDPDPGGGLAS